MQTPCDISIAGHFGEFLQGQMGPTGDVVLISLPCPNLRVHLSRRAGEFAIMQSPQQILSADQIGTLFEQCNAKYDGHFQLSHDMPAGGGAGASTAARVAFLRMLAPDLTPEEIASACFQSEGAVDPLMFPNTRQYLWASRKGLVKDTFGPLPRGRIIGGFVPHSEHTDASDNNFADISDLVTKWAEIKTLDHLANLSTISAKRNLGLRQPGYDPSLDILAKTGALGIVIAHTGSARGFIFHEDAAPTNIVDILRDSNFTHIVDFTFGGAS